MIKFGKIAASNIGPFETLELSLRDRGLLLVLGDNQDTTAADNNGSGKSHILKGVSWCLWDKTPDDDKADGLTRRGSDVLQVTVDWEGSDGEWSVTRTKKRGSSVQLLLEHNGHDVSAQTVADTQQEICRCLGMDFQTWRNTVLYAQGDVSRFSDVGTTDAERKLVLKRILRLDVLDKALKGARDQLAAIERQSSALVQEAGNVLAELRGLEAAGDLEAQLQAAQAEVSQYEAKAKYLPRQRKLVSDIQATINEIRERLQDADAARDEAANEQAAAQVALSQAATASSDRARAQSGLAQFEAGACPTCGSEADSPGVLGTVASLNEALAAADEAIAAAKAEAKAATARAAAAKARGETIKSEVSSETAEWYKKLEELRGSISAGEHALSAANQARSRAQQLKSKMDGIATRRATLEARGLEIATESDQLGIDKAHLEFWVRGFSNAGLSSYIMDNAMPALTQRANHYLGILADGDIQVTFDTQSKLKSGDTREKLSLSWFIEGELDTTPSGGQRKKISIAVDLALMDLVATRERSAVDLLMMDEMLDGLDATGRSRVLALLAELRQRRSTIIVISHDSDIAELFEQVVTARKSGRIATLV